MNIGKSIKVGMALKDMDYADITAIMGVSRQTLSAWVNGKSMPSMNAVGQLSEIFNAKVSVFIGG